MSRQANILSFDEALHSSSSRAARLVSPDGHLIRGQRASARAAQAGRSAKAGREQDRTPRFAESSFDARPISWSQLSRNRAPEGYARSFSNAPERPTERGQRTDSARRPSGASAGRATGASARRAGTAPAERMIGATTRRATGVPAGRADDATARRATGVPAGRADDATARRATSAPAGHAISAPAGNAGGARDRRAQETRNPRHAQHAEAAREDKAENGEARGLSGKLDKKKRERRKEKAGKEFLRQFGDAPSDASQNGPRAALYTGEVGAKQRQAMGMQHSSLDTGKPDRGMRAARRRRFFRSPRFLVTAGIAACLVLGCLFLYPTAKQYYQSVRQYDQLQAEYSAIQERNDALQQQVDKLQTPEGISERAHELYGWIEPGENSVLVQGLEYKGSANASGYTAAVTPGSVAAPETWYSPFLDFLFGL